MGPSTKPASLPTIVLLTSISTMYILKKLAVAELVKKITPFLRNSYFHYRGRKNHWTSSSHKKKQSLDLCKLNLTTYSHPISLGFILLLPYYIGLRLPNSLIPSDFRTKSPIRATCLVNRTLILWSVQIVKLLVTELRLVLLHPLAQLRSLHSSELPFQAKSQNRTFYSILLSYIFNPCCSLRIRDPHPPIGW
jgi:hypothetical protein